jgi:hypothetical protein
MVRSLQANLRRPENERRQIPVSEDREGFLMWTIILTFLKNPKNLLIVVLSACVLIVGGLLLFQRVSLAKAKAKVVVQAGVIAQYKQNEILMQSQLIRYADQIVKLRKLAESHQAVSTQTTKVVTKIKYIKSKCVMEGDDAKIASDVFEYFNTGRMRD